MHIWQIALAATAMLAAVRLVQLLLKSIKAWARNVRAAKTFPHTNNWSWIEGTFKKAHNNEHFLDVIRRTVLEYTEQFQEMFSVFLGPMMVTTVMVVHPKPAQVVLKEADEKSFEYEFVRPWLGDGILLSKGAKWHRNRKLLTPAFHFGILKSYVSVINEATDVLLEKLDGHCRSREPYWDVLHDVRLASLDVILQCAFSSKTNCQVVSESAYVKAVYELTEIALSRIFKIHMRSDLLYSLSRQSARHREALKIVHHHSSSIIESRKKALAASQGENGLPLGCDDDISEGKRRRMDFLDILLRAKDADGKGMDDDDIRAEVDTFLFAGHDTTSSGISWILFACAKYPEMQEKIRREVDEIMAGRDNDHLTLADLSQLKYTTLFIKEAMRIYPPVPSILRCPERDVRLGNYTVPKGTSIRINIYAMHHNRHVWGDDVEEFKPERFEFDDNKNEGVSERLGPFAYIPFSAGSRNCVGQNLAMNEIKVIVARLIRRFSVRTHPTIIPRPVFMLILRSLETHPILLSLEPRFLTARRGRKGA